MSLNKSIKEKVLQAGSAGHNVMMVFQNHEQKAYYTNKWFKEFAFDDNQLMFEDAMVVFKSATDLSGIGSFAADYLIFVNCQEADDEVIQICEKRVKSSQYGEIEHYNVDHGEETLIDEEFPVKGVQESVNQSTRPPINIEDLIEGEFYRMQDEDGASDSNTVVIKYSKESGKYSNGVRLDGSVKSDQYAPRLWNHVFKANEGEIKIYNEHYSEDIVITKYANCAVHSLSLIHI